MTCGVEFSVKAVTLPKPQDGSEADAPGVVELHLFDTAGQDIYAEILPSFWEGASAVILVYDATRAHTLEAAGNWYGRVLEALGKENMPGVLVAILRPLRLLQQRDL